MSLTKQHLTIGRTFGVAVVAALSLGACATKGDIDAINARLDQIDSRVGSASQSAASANQRLDRLEGRVQQLEAQPARQPRG
jgi:murein lipoprotein